MKRRFNLFLLAIFSTMMLLSCENSISLADQQFYLVKPELGGKRYAVIQCQFAANTVEFFAFKQTNGTADYTKGPYLVKHDQISFPKGTFEIVKVDGGYQLKMLGQVQHQLLTADGYKLYHDTYKQSAEQRK
ncbi:hypothetical protein [Pedobacter sandarakinus]|uniref:hypothetical protein n=1 Tax=Pedobacter sandarakinus TaxID=353156 RepID=UPI0022460EC8|nr:hypothetical protein [Pedobacter sandarakinus]MCX2573226.1 hypothetical protein [Pedobacter sandarakinus]